MKSQIIPVVLVVIGLWAVFSLAKFLWRVRAGQQVRAVTKKYERILATGPQILLAGDSVVFGVGATKPETSIAGLFGRDFPQAAITNLGVSGAETDGLVQQLQSVQGRHYALVVLVSGANDVVHLANLTKSLKQLDQALTLANGLSEHIVLMPEGNMGNAPIFPYPASLILTPRSRQFRAGAMALAQQHQTIFVDVFFERSKDPWRRRPNYFYAGDWFHPADPGYLDWYSAIRKDMKQANLFL